MNIPGSVQTRTEFTADDLIEFRVNVKNTGTRPGKESVLLFSSDLVASSIPDAIRLRDFTKVSLEPGESITVTFRIKASRLAFVGYDGRWRLEAGDFRIRCGNQSLMIRCTADKIWNTPDIL